MRSTRSKPSDDAGGSFAAAARERALEILMACEDGWTPASPLLEELQARNALGSADEALVAELVIGVLRHRLTCEHIAAHFHRGRWEGLRASIRFILALGVYQLCFLERIPDHAAVDQAVRMAKRRGRGTAEMANAVLRKVAATRGEILERPQSPDPRRYLAIDENRGRLFSENIFPDPARRPLDYLVAATSHPMWLVERWHRRFKSVLCRQVCDAGIRRPPLSLRANALRITSRALAERLSGSVLEGTEAVIVRGAARAADLPEFAEGFCQPQDVTAQLAVQLAELKPGEFVLDLCAGRGTKSVQAAERMGNEGIVIATDTDADELAMIDESAVRMGATIVRRVPMEGIDGAIAEMGRSPDVILVDAPCSNTGVLARRPEARYRASHKSLISLVALQREILERAVRLAGPATRIVYSTCSIEREENEEQAAWFCEAHPPWRLSREQFTLPDRDRDGGYVAVLVTRAG